MKGQYTKTEQEWMETERKRKEQRQKCAGDQRGRKEPGSLARQKQCDPRLREASDPWLEEVQGPAERASGWPAVWGQLS